MAKRQNLSEKKKDLLKLRLLNFLALNFENSLDDRSRIADELFASYYDNSRYYHNLEHIQNCLWELDQVKDQSIDKSMIELAIWYHDVIYSPISKVNELQSAKQMKEALIKFPSKINLDYVYKMILSSPQKGPKLTNSEQYFFDIDYSVLGQREIDYMAYKQNVRIEYSSVPSLLYYLKRKFFLKNLLKMGIFQTQYFKMRYESQAVLNIKSELAKMPYLILPTLPGKWG